MPALSTPAATLAPEGEADRPIARRSLHDEVTGRVRDMIVEGRLPPGERIAELELCARLGVSRTPLREALKVLAAEGLVELTPSRGAAVKAFTPKDIRDMLAVMALLEEHAGRKAAAAPDSIIRAIRARHDEMLRCYRKGDRPRYFQLNQEIHDAIVGAADNATLATTHAALKARMRRIRYAGHDGPANWRQAVEEHERMMAALEARDGRALGRLLRLHLANTWKRLEETLPDLKRAETAAAPAAERRPRQRSRGLTQRTRS